MDTHSGVDASLSVADPETRYRGSNKYEIYPAVVIFSAEFTEAMVDLGSDTDCYFPAATIHFNNSSVAIQLRAHKNEIYQMFEQVAMQFIYQLIYVTAHIKSENIPFSETKIQTCSVS